MQTEGSGGRSRPAHQPPKYPCRHAGSPRVSLRSFWRIGVIEPCSELTLCAPPPPQLLDILVKNCGYPFHLQISTKEFLNELVRRFPERPPTFPPPPMKKILELVHEWKNTICVTSKHKEDLVHIRDMHRLLSYKGASRSDIVRTLVEMHWGLPC